MDPSVITNPQRTLRWLYVGRLTLAAGIFGGAVGAWFEATGVQSLLATLALFASLAVTFGSLWYTYGLGRPAGRNFFYAQVLFDTLLVTTIVSITNTGAGSDFAPLYILVIAAGSLLLPLPGGMLIGALACVLYFADLVWWHGPSAGGPALDFWFIQVPAGWASVILQIGLFAVIALVTGALTDRLRSAGHALGAVESELRQLRLDTNDMLAAIDTGLVTVDDTGRLVYLNDAAAKLLHLPEREWAGRTVLDELDRRAPGLGSVIKRTSSLAKPISRFEIRMRDDLGHERFLAVRTTVLERADAPWVTAVFQDVTDSRQIEELMRRAERLQAVAELGASLAHEIKNPLASIRSATEQLAGSRLTERDRGVLRNLVVKESDRLSRLLADFMEFSRIELRRWGSVDLTKVTRDAIRLVQQHPDAAGRNGIVFDPPRDAVLVTGDEDLLHRAVFNLLLNAVQHSGPNGKVTVELGRIQRREVPSSVPMERPIRLAVADEGPGIAPEAVGRIFDPFFTTREGGTGLGLALVHRAVEAHQGMILVDGGPEHGAQFTVYLPGQAEKRA